MFRVHNYVILQDPVFSTLLILNIACIIPEELSFHNLIIVFSCFLNIKSLHFAKLLNVTQFCVTHEVTFTCQLLSVEWLSSVVCLQFRFLMAM